MENGNTTLARSAYEAFDRGDVATVISAMASDIELNVPQVLPGKLDGVETGYGFVHSWTVRDGALARFDEYVNPAPELLSRGTEAG